MFYIAALALAIFVVAVWRFWIFVEAVLEFIDGPAVLNVKVHATPQIVELLAKFNLNDFTRVDGHARRRRSK